MARVSWPCEERREAHNYGVTLTTMGLRMIQAPLPCAVIFVRFVFFVVKGFFGLGLAAPQSVRVFQPVAKP